MKLPITSQTELDQWQWKKRKTRFQFGSLQIHLLYSQFIFEHVCRWEEERREKKLKLIETNWNHILIIDCVACQTNDSTILKRMHRTNTDHAVKFAKRQIASAYCTLIRSLYRCRCRCVFACTVCLLYDRIFWIRVCVYTVLCIEYGHKGKSQRFGSFVFVTLKTFLFTNKFKKKQHILLLHMILLFSLIFFLSLFFLFRLW